MNSQQLYNQALISIPNMSKENKLLRLRDEIHDCYHKIAKLAERKTHTSFIHAMTRHIDKLKASYVEILNSREV